MASPWDSSYYPCKLPALQLALEYPRPPSRHSPRPEVFHFRPLLYLLTTWNEDHHILKDQRFPRSRYDDLFEVYNFLAMPWSSSRAVFDAFWLPDDGIDHHFNYFAMAADSRCLMYFDRPREEMRVLQQWTDRTKTKFRRYIMGNTGEKYEVPVHPDDQNWEEADHFFFDEVAWGNEEVAENERWPEEPEITEEHGLNEDFSSEHVDSDLDDDESADEPQGCPTCGQCMDCMINNFCCDVFEIEAPPSDCYCSAET